MLYTLAVRRIAAIDWMRGIVMVFMAIDHASMMLNSGRVSADTAAHHVVGTVLDPSQFFTRWITHLCAPTFVFLAGTAIAVSTTRRRERGASSWSIDRDLLIRGALITLLDLVLMSRLAGTTLLQVLYAIGVSMMLMVPLRRLGMRSMLIGSLAFMIAAEALTGLFWDPAAGGGEALWVNLFLAPLFSEGLVIVYPALPWLAVMMLGWVFGERLVEAPGAAGPGAWSPVRLLTTWGAAALGLFVVLRGVDGYGNMFLHRDDGSIVQWLHVSKYPPSLTYLCLELGLMALCLAALMRLEPRVKVRDNGPLLVFGQTALFFYILHFILLGASRELVDQGGLGLAYAGAAAVLVVLYPVCRVYRTIKRKNPKSALRFI